MRAMTPDPKPKTRNAKLPFVFVNMAITADGKIATANRKVSTFASRRDHEHLLELRATADAVMSGAGTVNAGPITLGPGGARFQRLRLRRGLAEYNLRVIVSGGGNVDPRAEVFRHRFSPIILLTTARAKNLPALRAVVDDVKPCGARELNFRTALLWLRKKWKVKRLLCEGGGEVNGALFRAGLVDEVHLTVSPKIFGGADAPTLAGGAGGLKLADAAEFRLKSAKRVGDEMFLVYGRK